MGIHVGLDIGIASVGWAVVDDTEKHILGIGVRKFSVAEDPKTGASLAMPRRVARSARRRLRRRRIRMNSLRELFLTSGMISAEQLETLFDTDATTLSPFKLRAEALDRRLEDTEWARVLTQLCKRRGYKSMKLGDKPDDDEGVVKAAIAANRVLMNEKGYRTAGEMFSRDERFETSKRNRGDYKGVVSRELLLEEIATLFEAQREMGNAFAGEALEKNYVEILSWQAPIQEGDALLAKVGVCSIDKSNKRIPLACPTFERFRVVDKLHNVRYTLAAGGGRIPLDADQKACVLEEVFDRATVADYAKIRKLCSLPSDARFVGVRYSRTSPDDLSSEKREKLPFPKAFVHIRKSVMTVSPESWELLSSDAQLLDRIAHVLTYFKLDESVRRELSALELDPDVVEALADHRFSGNGHLSRETLLRILPAMEDGLSYTDACGAVGLHHSQRAEGERFDKLPAIPTDEVRNPVVLRSLSQSRKVLNAIIDRYGAIEELHVELARDVSKSSDDRKKIERKQKDSRATNDSVREDLESLYGLESPRGLDFVKYKLWKEQGGRCAYSGAYIDPQRMLSREYGVAEVDHILPHSRSFDDGYMNKVLVTGTENQRKGNRTPFEYLGGDSRRWHEFEELISSMHLPRPKSERLLRQDFDERASDDFRERNLIDTQYTARYFKNFVEQNLRFDGDKKLPVLTVNGRATAFLRTGWRLQKVRAESDLHHALDAAVIAVTNRSMVQAVSRFFSVRSLRSIDGYYVVPETGEIIDAKHVPEPWEGFGDQLKGRLEAQFGPDPVADLTDDSLEQKPILVSRMPKHTVRGEIHKETVRRIEGEDLRGRTITSKKVQLTNLKLKDLKRMVGKGQDHELYELLRTRLETAGNDPTKAFAEPVFKPTRPGRVAPRVLAIRVMDDPSSGGTEVRGGLADNGAMVRTDVFEQDSKFYLVPVYLKDTTAHELPVRACVGGKAEKDWRVMDDSYKFRFSLFLDDLIRLEKRVGDTSEVRFGYFKGMNRATCSISIDSHNGSATFSSIGVAQSVIAFDKYQPDILGQGIYLVRQESRLGFSNGDDRF